MDLSENNGPKLSWSRLRELASAFRYTGRAMALVRSTSPRLLLILGVLTLFAGLLPGSIAWVGKHIVDAVVSAAGEPGPALRWLTVELALVAVFALVQRALMACEQLLRAQLGFRVNEMILERALTLSMQSFEDSAFYDKMTRARREASVRPLALVQRVFGLIQNGISLATYGGLLLAFSPIALAVLVAAAIPSFVAEAKFSGAAFRLFRWRVPETRMQMYLETVLAREDSAKEVKLFGIGALLLDRYRAIFHKLFGEDRALTLRRSVWGGLLGLLGTGAFYGAYAWILIETVRGTITLGDMTMYLVVFRQGQSAIAASLSAVSGMYEDNLYLSNLYEYLEEARPERLGGQAVGPTPGDGVRFEGVSYTYPGSSEPALSGVTLHIRPGEKLALVGENGSGKTTLIKLVGGLYEPTEGRVLVDGLDVRAWDLTALRNRFAVIFQDFQRYQMLVGENIGVGDVAHVDEEPRWRDAAEKGLSREIIERLPKGYRTQLGRWFDDGRELSGGQWQKIALSRLFMRRDADILVLDEPTSAMDAEAEVGVFERVRELAPHQVAVLISHRFSTVRMADRIAVLHRGAVAELGTHEELIALDGRYAHLFALQAKGYQ